MEKFVIKGGNRLTGEVTISGAKNAAVAIVPAVVLATEPCTIENIPNISDITILIKILKDLGVEVKMVNKNTLYLDPRNINSHTVPYEYAHKLRASYYFMGALLGRFRKASVALPGGCNLGTRPIDQHQKAFEALGATVDITGGVAEISGPSIEASHIFFDVVSVGATVNAMLAAATAPGTTVLENVAKEPHIVDLANFLNTLGADIRGAGTDVIKIHGVRKLGGGTYSIIPDQIEAGTYMCMAAVTKGDVKIKNVIPRHLESITSKLKLMGVDVVEGDDWVRIRRYGDIQKINIKTMPHPGFPTDMQSQISTVLAMAKGTSIVTEGVWDNRFKFIDELVRMGADIQVDGKVAVIEGVETFTGARVKATDLRGGAAVVIAALAAEGVTEIEQIFHIERGYQDIENKLRALGADIKKVYEIDDTMAEAL